MRAFDAIDVIHDEFGVTIVAIKKMTSIKKNTKKLPGPFLWVGGKNRIRSKIAPILETAKRPVYVEPFGGSAAMLLALEPAKREIYNDADGRVADFFRALIDPSAFAEMKRYAAALPKSRELYEELKTEWTRSESLAKRGFATFYVQSFSFGGRPFNSFGVEREFYPAKRRGGTTALFASFERRAARLDEYAARFRSVVVESSDWRAVFRRYDSPNALFYVDPPYCVGTQDFYRRDLPPVDHTELVETLLKARGRVALSCYWSDVYEPLLSAGWTRFDFAASSSVRRATDNVGASRARTETLLTSPDTAANLAGA